MAWPAAAVIIDEASEQPIHLDVPPKLPDGWRAHRVVITHLERPEHRTRLH
ncbi:hypothetical protein ACFU7Y_03850 [Kitasatospora sp. NPDC057542]|uniref:hypothetical protein n=1 Tax=Streptomycetaceae TaxID=2062 RepID=UPI001CCCDEE5|nr:hypothetical protein [Streptomyces sp. LS1784]